MGDEAHRHDPTVAQDADATLTQPDGQVVDAGGRERDEHVVGLHVDHLDVDRPLFPDHNTMAALVKSGEILEAVETRQLEGTLRTREEALEWVKREYLWAEKG